MDIVFDIHNVNYDNDENEKTEFNPTSIYKLRAPRICILYYAYSWRSFFIPIFFIIFASKEADYGKKDKIPRRNPDL